ncbi:MAG: Polysaccharide biosynthesis related protein [Acidobacteria bacterium]|nr:Polysaccharide biosynthesis related protein [Acidobacteriota bacterium]
MTAAAVDKKFMPSRASPGVTQNLLWMVWSGSISIANSVVLWIFMARMRDVEEMGRFTIVMGLYALFYNVCSLGLMPFLVNEISRKIESAKLSENAENEERKLSNFIGSASVILFFSGIVCAAAMTIAAFFVSDSWSVRVSTLVLSFAVIPTGLICVSEAAAIAHGRTGLIAFVSTFENLLRTIIPFALIWLGFDISVICASFVAVRIAALFPYLQAARHRLKQFNFDVSEFVKILKATPTFAGTITLASVNWQAAIILLGYLSTEIESAKYGVASRFLIPVSILLAGYSSVIQPVLARHVEKSFIETRVYLSKMLRYPLLAATLAAFISPFLSTQILTSFFGASYAETSTTLNILALCVIPFCLVMIVSRGLVATGSQHIDLLANALGVFACVIMCWILIPIYGAAGAAAAQLFSLLLMALLEAVYLSKRLSEFRFQPGA